MALATHPSPSGCASMLSSGKHAGFEIICYATSLEFTGLSSVVDLTNLIGRVEVSPRSVRYTFETSNQSHDSGGMN